MQTRPRQYRGDVALSHPVSIIGTSDIEGVKSEKKNRDSKKCVSVEAQTCGEENSQTGKTDTARNCLPGDAAGLLHVVDGSLGDLGHAAPELGPALGVALQALDVVILDVLLLLGHVGGVNVGGGDGGALGDGVSLGGVAANGLSGV